MSDTDKYDFSHARGRNPFTVPPGYFDHIASDVMARLPEAEAMPRVGLWRRWRYVAAAAACLCGLVVGVASYVGHVERQQAVAAAQRSVDKTIDQMADYAMYDNGDMYASLYDY